MSLPPWSSDYWYASGYPASCRYACVDMLMLMLMLMAVGGDGDDGGFRFFLFLPPRTSSQTWQEEYEQYHAIHDL